MILRDHVIPGLCGGLIGLLIAVFLHTGPNHLIWWEVAIPLTLVFSLLHHLIFPFHSDSP